MALNPKISIILQDAETEKLYKIFVTKDEAKRINTEPDFATMKLQEAIQMHHDANDDDEDVSMENIEVSDENGKNSCALVKEDTGVFKWPHDAILLLIEEYRSQEYNFNNGKHSQKKIWNDISETMNAYGYKVTGPQCQSKLTGLKRTYKSIKNYNSKFENDVRSWPYFDMMNDIISPLTTASSSKRARQTTSTSNMEQFMADLMEKRMKAEKAVERHRRETHAQRERFLNLFEKLVETMSKNKK